MGYFPSCARRTISGSACPTRTTSSAVESRPREKRTSEFAWVRRPRATITCEGSREPAEQAEPLEAQIPSKSSPARSAMLSAPRTTNATVFASRCLREPITTAPSIFSIIPINFAANGASLDRSKTGVLTNLSIASAKPTMPARFSVPARRSFSCPPPNKTGSGCNGDLI